jgi:hypothetical protein
MKKKSRPLRRENEARKETKKICSVSSEIQNNEQKLFRRGVKSQKIRFDHSVSGDLSHTFNIVIDYYFLKREFGEKNWSRKNFFVYWFQ